MERLKGPRIGLLGGTFDPPHYGHLLLAQEAAWQLELERVLFVPTRQNPLKRTRAVSAVEDRLEMTELAVLDDARFQVSRADVDRPAPSYTVDLLRQMLREECPPESQLYFLVGADLLAELPTWYQPEELLQLATLVVANRPGWPAPDIATIEEAFQISRGRVCAVTLPGVDVSATDLRRRVRAGQPIRYLTPTAVEEYIGRKRLYVEE